MSTFFSIGKWACQSTTGSRRQETSLLLSFDRKPLQQCHALVYYKRIALLIFACLQPVHRRNTSIFRAWSSSVHGASLANMMFCHMHKWCNLIGAALFLQQLTTVLIANLTSPSPTCKRGRGLRTRLLPLLHGCRYRTTGQTRDTRLLFLASCALQI